MEDFNEQYESLFWGQLKDYINLEKNNYRSYQRESYSVEAVKKLAAAAGNPEKELAIIHIAGTKGKGSVAYFLASLLSSADISCGVFTSPHLITVRERFLINNEMVSYSLLLETTGELRKTADQAGLNPTFFEFLTVLALVIFRRQGCSHAIMETGIGGLLDATNYIRYPLCSVITPISYDHTGLLGNTIEEIAGQKAGIIKDKTPVVCGRQPFPEVIPVVKKTALAEGAGFYEVTDSPPDISPWIETRLPAFQKENFQTALKVCEVLQIIPKPEHFQLFLPPGRCQCLQRNPLVIIDAAHNRDSAARLVEGVNALYPDNDFTVVLGVAEGKDAEGIIAELTNIARMFILTNPRPFKKSQLPALIRLADTYKLDYRVIQTIETREQLPATENLLFTGSFFTAVIGQELFPE
ncbi:MAG: bifunctional folylpolyglutamate synthase/dihydrofolate synthase [Verrucomicrobiota bacterium]